MVQTLGATCITHVSAGAPTWHLDTSLRLYSTICSTVACQCSSFLRCIRLFLGNVHLFYDFYNCSLAMIIYCTICSTVPGRCSSIVRYVQLFLGNVHLFYDMFNCSCAMFIYSSAFSTILRYFYPYLGMYISSTACSTVPAYCPTVPCTVLLVEDMKCI